MATTPLSVIGQTTTIRGGIRGEGDLEILGRVEGSVVVEGEVTVGETALVKSDVRARRVIVRGAVRGSVSADELLVLEAGARVLGDLGAPQVGIRPGGLVKGHVSTAGPLPLERPKPAVAAKAAPSAPRAVPAARPATPAARPAPVPARPTPAARSASDSSSRPAPAARVEPEVAPAAKQAPPRAVAAPPPPPPPPPPPEPEPEPEAAAEPPPPVVPALPKGRAAARKKGAK